MTNSIRGITIQTRFRLLNSALGLLDLPATKKSPNNNDTSSFVHIITSEARNIAKQKGQTSCSSVFHALDSTIPTRILLHELEQYKNHQHNNTNGGNSMLEDIPEDVIRSSLANIPMSRRAQLLGVSFNSTPLSQMLVQSVIDDIRHHQPRRCLKDFTSWVFSPGVAEVISMEHGSITEEIQRFFLQCCSSGESSEDHITELSSLLWNPHLCRGVMMKNIITAAMGSLHKLLRATNSLTKRIPWTQWVRFYEGIVLLFVNRCDADAERLCLRCEAMLAFLLSNPNNALACGDVPYNELLRVMILRKRKMKKKQSSSTASMLEDVLLYDILPRHVYTLDEAAAVRATYLLTTFHRFNHHSAPHRHRSYVLDVLHARLRELCEDGVVGVEETSTRPMVMPAHRKIFVRLLMRYSSLLAA
eukprot:PhF_6_TR29133/c0_g1_i1/m.42541